MNGLRQLWDKISYIGTANVVSETRIYKIRLFNQLMIFCIILSFSLFLIVLLGGDQSAGLIIPSCIIISAYIFALWLNYKEYFVAARHFIASTYILLTLAAFFLSTTEPPYAISMYVFLAAVFFIMENRQDYNIYVAAVLLVFVIVFAQHFFIEKQELIFENYATFIYSLFFLGALIVVLKLFKKENNIYQSALSSKQVLLDEAQNLAGIGTWTYYPHFNRMECSAALHDLMECQITGEIDFKNYFLSHFPPEYQEEFEALLDENATDCQKIEFTTQVKMGNKMKWVRVTGAKYKDAKSFRIYGIMQDITSDREALTIAKKAEELRQLNQDLQRSNSELQQFAYVASHDLQEPLRMVGNFVQLLEEEYGEEVGQEGKLYIDYAVSGVQRMSQLIDELLQYSRVGRKEVAMRFVKVEGLVQNKITDMLSYIKERKANVQIQGLDFNVFCEPHQLGIVFQNLIQNGIKFNKNEIPLIKISVKEEAENWLFSIKDNGIGIAPANQDKIFDIFKRLHRKEVYQGTGIGLALVKRIILRHKGKIWIESELGQGTTFYFTIPKKNIHL